MKKWTKVTLGLAKVKESVVSLGVCMDFMQWLGRCDVYEKLHFVGFYG